MQSSRSRTRPNWRRRRNGFTLVELLVAVLLVDIGVLAMVSGTAMIARRQVELRARIAATQVASNRIQRLIATPCVATNGSANADRGIVERWSVTLLPNAQRDLHDSVVFATNGVERSVTIRSRTPC
jgi:Tfp pilus assembly protein PilV